MNKKIVRRLSLLLVMAGCGTGAFAAVSQVPVLSNANAVAPNLIFTLDDSGSMDFECLPDALCTSGLSRVGAVPGALTGFKTGVAEYDSLFGARLRTVEVNPLYYDPAVRYLPWLNADGSRRPQFSARAAPDDPAAPTINVFDLASVQTITSSWCSSQVACATGARDVRIAQYYRLNPGATGAALSDFTQTQIVAGGVYPKAATRDDCAASTCSAEEELQNFSNWFTYSRSRLKVAIAGTSETFAKVPDYFRVGFGTINSLAHNVDGVTTDTLLLGVRPFTGADKAAFYTSLQAAVTADGGTPLRRAMADVGIYYSRTDSRGPWSDSPASGRTKPDVSCRRSFNLLMTDGLWNGTEAGRAGPAGASLPPDVDNTTGPLIAASDGSSYQYVPAPPFAGPGGGTLADVAMYYWNHDLRLDLANNLSASKDLTDPLADPAFWQHMVNYTIAFGVSGKLNNPADLNALITGTKDWGMPTDGGQEENVDDLWHAAINSRGTSANAGNRAQYEQAIDGMLRGIENGKGKEAAVAVSALSVSTAARKYVPEYKSGWNGELSALVIGATDPVWKASEHIPAPALRNISTVTKANAGAAFTLAGLDSANMTTLLGSPDAGALINYLRGDQSMEGAGGVYRKRTSLLGDIVNSSPLYVRDQFDGQYDFLATGTPGQSIYRKFLQSKKERQPQVFVGANDGMLHAFSDADGAETFAFVPRSVIGNLKELAKPDYQHRFYVDGPMVEADIYDGPNSQWRNMVFGGSGAGAKNLFAINVPVSAYGPSGPVPMSLDASTPKSTDIRWEINAADPTFAELGNNLHKPEVGLLRDGTWVVIVGNGYDSASRKAQLFIVNAMTGKLVKAIDTGVGSTSQPNGLGGVRALLDSQQRIVGVYAGDLRGNMWKFDLSSSAQGDWSVAFGGQPLFTAVNALGQAEPITAAPTYQNHPLGGVMVLSGTGKLFETSDTANTEQRTLYGVWDKVTVGSASTNSALALTNNSALVAQSVSATPLAGTVGGTFYTVSGNTVDYGSSANKRGWKLPLTQSQGQRLVYDPWLAVGRAFFDTLVPSDPGVPCVRSDKSFTFVLDPLTGGAAEDGPTLDTDGNRVFGVGDVKAAAVFARDGAGGTSGIQTERAGEIQVVGSGIAPTAVSGARTTVARAWRQIVSPP